MSAVNPLQGQGRPADAGTTGGNQQQRWLQDLERAWLRSWQQVAPPSAAPAVAAAPGSSVERAGGALAALPLQALRPAVQGVAAATAAGPAVPLSGVAEAPVAASFSFPPAGFDGNPTDGAPVATPWTPPPASVVPAAARTQHPLARDAAAPAAPPRAPSRPPPAEPGLHLREPATGAVMAALRDARFGAAASAAAASALARQLADAGYTRVRVYVNGVALQHGAAESSRPLQAHSQEQPGHGH